MQTFSNIIGEISGILWGWPMIVLLFGTHIFLTFRLKFPQRKILTAIKLSVKSDDGSKGDVSNFGALATSLAATIGTGNIIGVATAIALGGPGAVFWCWLVGLFGIATKYGEGLLAVKYRIRTYNNEMAGGPMYALERGLGMKWLAILFCIFTAGAAFGIGNAVQANAICDNIIDLAPSSLSPEMFKLCIGITISILTGLVIFGGIKSITRICTGLIPFMALLYIIGCIIILFTNSHFIWDSICWICSDAFSLKAGIGGTAGVAIMTTMRYGIARGLFSNESGMGSAPIVAAAAQSHNPVRQALILSSGAFWDTFVICTLTGLVIVSGLMSNMSNAGFEYAGQYSQEAQAFLVSTFENSGRLTKLSFATLPGGEFFLSFAIVTFAFSTILGWAYYGEKAIQYLFGRKSLILYRTIWTLLPIVACVISLNLVWDIADILNALMAIPNLVSLILLSGVMAKETQHYLWNNHIDEISKETSDNTSNE